MRLVQDSQVIELVDPQAAMALRGFKAWTTDPNTTNATLILTTTNEIAVKVPTPNTILVSNISVFVSTAGSSLTSGQNLATLYRADGTLLSSTADQTTAWASSGGALMPLTTPQTLQGSPGGYCWVGLLSNGTTPVTLRAGSGQAALVNITGTGTASGAAMWSALIGTGRTAPATFTPSSLATTSISYWIGLS